jgi:hypothetical protein
MTLWMTEFSGFRGLYPTSDRGAWSPWAALEHPGCALHRTGVLRADAGFAALRRGPGESSPAVFRPSMRALSRAMRSWVESGCTPLRYAKGVPEMGPCKFDGFQRQDGRIGGGWVTDASRTTLRDKPARSRHFVYRPAGIGRHPRHV